MEDKSPHFAMSWRQRDILPILNGPETKEKQLLHKFRPFNKQFLDEAGIELPDQLPICDISTSILSPEQNTKIPFSFEEHRKKGKEAIDRVPFSAWIQLSLEMPSVHINTLKQEMEKLSRLVFDTESGNFAKYKLDIELKCHQTHRFIYDALRHAVGCIIEGKYSPFELSNLDIIKGPLEGILNQALPVKEVLRQLNYINLNCPLSEVSLRDLIDIDWGIPEKLHQTGARTIAREMVKADYRIFQELHHCYVNDFVIRQSLQRMNHRWQFLFSTAKSKSSDPVMRNKLMKLIKLLHRAKNYYSMTAIKQGLESEGFYVPACHLKDSERSALHMIPFEDSRRLEDILQASCSYPLMISILISLF